MSRYKRHKWERIETLWDLASPGYCVCVRCGVMRSAVSQDAEGCDGAPD